MKRAKLRDLVRDVLEERAVIGDRPVTFDNLAIDFDARRVTFRGRTINVDTIAVVFPLLSTDHIIILKGNGEVV